MATVTRNLKQACFSVGGVLASLGGLTSILLISMLTKRYNASSTQRSRHMQQPSLEEGNVPEYMLAGPHEAVNTKGTITVPLGPGSCVLQLWATTPVRTPNMATGSAPM